MPSRLTSFAGWVWAALVAATIVVPGRGVHAQALEPRSYANTPVGINFVLLGYGYTEGDVGFDASSPIKDAKVHVHAGLLAYARSLDVWGLSGKALAVLPMAEASGSAKVKGQEHDRQVFGLGDPLLRVSVNVYGAPALSMADFLTYQQDVIVGVSLQVTAPLGQYDSTKLLNVGTNRWSFKPELGVSKAWGPVILEVIPAVTFFTKNDDFFGGKTLEQNLVSELQGMGLPAVPAAGQAPPQVGDITIVGYFVSVDPGSVAKRFALGFGSGAAALQTVVEGYLMTDKGLRRLGEGEISSAGPKGPGEALPLAMAVASGNPIGLIVSSAVKIGGEASGMSTVEGSAKRTAQEIAEKLKAAPQRQGWI